MKLTPNSKIKRNKETIFKEVDDVVYILDPRKATIHTLNRTASFIWKKLEKPISIKALTFLVCDKFEVERSEAQSNIIQFAAKYLQEEFLKKI